MTARIVSWAPFIVEYIEGAKSKKVSYDVVLTKREIQEEMPYIVFDNEEQDLKNECDLNSFEAEHC